MQLEELEQFVSNCVTYFLFESKCFSVCCCLTYSIMTGNYFVYFQFGIPVKLTWVLVSSASTPGQSIKYSIFVCDGSDLQCVLIDSYRGSRSLVLCVTFYRVFHSQQSSTNTVTKFLFFQGNLNFFYLEASAFKIFRTKLKSYMAQKSRQIVIIDQHWSSVLTDNFANIFLMISEHFYQAQSSWYV